MAIYYKDPYKMYYEQLSSSKEMKNAAIRVNDGSDNLLTAFIKFQSQTESLNWKELGHSELINNSIPTLISMVKMFKDNVLALSKAANRSIDVLFPILEKLKIKDEDYEKTKNELNSLEEPSNKYKTEYNEKTGKYETTSKYTSEYSTYLSKKEKLEECVNNLEKELKILIISADEEIIFIKVINNSVQKFNSLSDFGKIADTLGLNLTESDEKQLFNGNKSLKIVNIEYFNSDDPSKSGNYFIVTFSNGKKLYLHQQKDGTYGNWGNIDIGKKNTWNGGGGCSVFSTSAAFSWLLGQYVPPRAVMMAGGGQLDGIRTIAADHEPVNINGEEYIIDADVSESNLPYGSTSNKEEVVNDWYTTLENGGAVVIAVGGRSQPVREYFDNGKKARIVERADDINQRTGITSQGGHVIAMVGLDENGKIIFADSIYDVGDDGNDKVLDSRAYDKGLTLSEFYDLYGGRGNNTHIDSRDKTYVTIENATITKV